MIKYQFIVICCLSSMYSCGYFSHSQGFSVSKTGAKWCLHKSRATTLLGVCCVLSPNEVRDVVRTELHTTLGDATTYYDLTH